MATIYQRRRAARILESATERSCRLCGEPAAYLPKLERQILVDLHGGPSRFSPEELAEKRKEYEEAARLTLTEQRAFLTPKGVSRLDRQVAEALTWLCEPCIAEYATLYGYRSGISLESLYKFTTIRLERIKANRECRLPVGKCVACYKWATRWLDDFAGGGDDPIAVCSLHFLYGLPKPPTEPLLVALPKLLKLLSEVDPASKPGDSSPKLDHHPTLDDLRVALEEAYQRFSLMGDKRDVREVASLIHKFERKLRDEGHGRFT